MDISIRPAIETDADTIAHHRVAMFQQMGNIATRAVADELFRSSVPVIRAGLEDGTYIGWLAVTPQDRIVAGAGAHIRPQLPRPSLDGQTIECLPAPLIVNVYTEPDYRRSGLARLLMNTVLDWATQRGSGPVVLHASDAGRAHYESLGFKPTNEMRWSPV